MSDDQKIDATKQAIMKMDDVKRGLRNSFGEEAEERWKADEERKKLNIEAHTAYLEAARADVLVQQDRADARHADLVRAYDELGATNARIAAASERQAVALEALAEAMKAR